MQTVSGILKIISNNSDNTDQVLCDLMPLSCAGTCDKYYGVISSAEAEALLLHIQEQKKKNIFTDCV
ncbi:hypothetical protein [Morganella morganii]|uniref:hypothetical protein n=1 Tax=Morganella morganii TaxID=582 RepID=UPI001BDA7523|nr:hypothetical protein [Morganella morganii]EKT0592084.1 hypothetical protein [Morganella morganii]ELF0885239.1 hypothetical protein [Morganella morganii]MBT0389592.1 hypothetical protein [Morganella morganii subsp. morganii]HCR3195611.1 hypothetical protein [Morganella morganii]HEI8571786.1 hypothetical protein [Morganella morganii]